MDYKVQYSQKFPLNIFSVPVSVFIVNKIIIFLVYSY